MPETSDDSKLAKLADDLKSELDEVYAANERTADAYDRAVEQRDQLAEQTDTLAEKIELLESEVASVADARVDLQSKLASAANASHAAEDQLKSALNDLKIQNEKLAASLQAVTGREAKLLDRAESISSDLKSAQQSLQTANSEVSRLADELLQRDAELNSQQSAHENLQAENVQLANTIGDLETQRNDSIGRMKELQLTDAQLRQEAVQTATEIAAWKVAETQNVHRLAQQVEITNGLTAKIHDAESESQRLQVKAASVEAELRSSLDRASHETALLRTDLSALEKDRDSLTEVLSRERAGRVLTDRAAEKLTVNLTTQQSATRGELAAARAQTQRVVLEHQALSDQVGVKASELRQTEVLLSDFVRELERTGTELKEQTAELHQLREAKRSSEQRITDRIRDLETQLVVVQQRVNESEDTLQRERGINVELVREIANQASNCFDEPGSDPTQDAVTPEPEPKLEPKPTEEPPAANANSTPTEPTKQAGDKKDSRSKRKRKSTRTTDDLTLIEGVGPKMRDLLIAKRITTFQKLSTTKVAKLERMLSKAGISLKRHDPRNWPEQAKLAADGNFDRLEELKQNLAKSWVTHCVRPVH